MGIQALVGMVPLALAFLDSYLSRGAQQIGSGVASGVGALPGSAHDPLAAWGTPQALIPLAPGSVPGGVGVPTDYGPKTPYGAGLGQSYASAQYGAPQQTHGKDPTQQGYLDYGASTPYGGLTPLAPQQYGAPQTSAPYTMPGKDPWSQGQSSAYGGLTPLAPQPWDTSALVPLPPDAGTQSSLLPGSGDAAASQAARELAVHLSTRSRSQWDRALIRRAQQAMGARLVDGLIGPETRGLMARWGQYAPEGE